MADPLPMADTDHECLALLIPFGVCVMTVIRTTCLLVVMLVAPTIAAGAAWRVGIAKTDITPTSPTWMAGYASRTRPADGAIHPLWAKALAIEDAQGNKAVLLAVDVIGLPRAIAEPIEERIQAETGIPREAVLLNLSHTHSGPVINGLTVTYNELKSDQTAALVDYARGLQDKLVAVARMATESMRPADLAFGQGKAAFAMNRRLPRDGKFIMTANPNGPVDDAVPVLRVTDENGRLIAVLFGYACHNTTLADYQYCGDYAGFAQIALEKAHPDATALFMIGCAGDANPHPDGSVNVAEKHGHALADAVDTVLREKLAPVAGPLRVAFARVNLPLVDPPSKEQLVARRGQGNVHEQRLTELLLARLDAKGSIAASCSCPIRVFQFGDALTLIGLSGEPVADYALRLRAEFPTKRLWIAGYCNEVFAYVPSERVLAEGGYEGGDSMTYFGLHGPFKPGIEHCIIDAVKQLADPEINKQP